MNHLHNIYLKALWRFIDKQNVYLLYPHGAYIIVGNIQTGAGNSWQGMLTIFEDALRSKTKHKRHHVKVRRNFRGHPDHSPYLIYKTFKVEKCQGLNQSDKVLLLEQGKETEWCHQDGDIDGSWLHFLSK